MDANSHSSLEHACGSFLANLKRDHDDDSTSRSTPKFTKKSRSDLYDPPMAEITTCSAANQPYPFFNYVDYSQDPDPDPFVPLTAPGRVPNFPAKMHAILCREDLNDIICWQPHGRAWKVLKPREFEIRIIPKYFEHSKFSSFVRQANGWGFRRITTGRDRNSYYHPKFLRGLPHLCKDMKRPGVAGKMAVDPDQEPDLAKISEQRPIPLKPADEQSTLLGCTLTGGPKARMPVASLSMIAAHTPLQHQSHVGSSNLSSIEREELSTLSRGGFANQKPKERSRTVAPKNQHIPTPVSLPNTMFPRGNNEAHILAAANQMAWNASASGVSPHMFAAGFAAAMAQTFGQPQFQQNSQP